MVAVSQPQCLWRGFSESLLLIDSSQPMRWEVLSFLLYRRVLRHREAE